MRIWFVYKFLDTTQWVSATNNYVKEIKEKLLPFYYEGYYIFQKKINNYLYNLFLYIIHL